MMLGLYVDADSPIHKMGAGFKIGALVCLGTSIVLLNNLIMLGLLIGLVAVLYAIARIPPGVVWRQVRPAFYLIVIIFAFQIFRGDWMVGAVMALRFILLILFSVLVTLTTRVSQMVEVVEKAINPLRRIGVNPRKAGLAISLSIRFIPVIAQNFKDIREAQRARGCGRSIVATAVPLIVRTLRMANDVAEALEARSYDDSPGARKENAATRKAPAVRFDACHSSKTEFLG